MASQLVGESASFEWWSYVHGHHVYCLEWMQVVGELLTLKREPENPYDRHSVVVMKGEQLVGHPMICQPGGFLFLGQGWSQSGLQRYWKPCES